MQRLWVSMKFALLALVMAVLPACASIQGAFTGENKGAELVLKATVVTGTAKLIDGEAERREEVLRVAHNIDNYLSKNPEGRAGEIVQIIWDFIPVDKLSENDAFLIAALLDTIQDDIQYQIEKGLVPEDVSLRARTFVRWVIQAAEARTGFEGSDDTEGGEAPPEPEAIEAT